MKVIEVLRQLGYSIRLEGGTICYRCTNLIPSPEARPLLAELRRRKPEVMKFLVEESGHTQDGGPNTPKTSLAPGPSALGEVLDPVQNVTDSPLSTIARPRPIYTTPAIALKALGRAWMLHELPAAIARAKSRARDSATRGNARSSNGPSNVDFANLPPGWRHGQMGLRNLSHIACVRCGHKFDSHEHLLEKGATWSDVRRFCESCFRVVVEPAKPSG